MTRTAFIDRRWAAITFRHHRDTWDRETAWTLTLAQCAASPLKRFAAAYTLHSCRIPIDGKHQEIKP